MLNRFYHRFLLFLLAIAAAIAIPACDIGISQQQAGSGKLSTPPAQTNKQQSSCRVVKHAMGEACVPRHPQRIAVLGLHGVSSLLSLRVKPIGVPSNILPDFADDLADVEKLGMSDRINIEKLLTLQPDLILASSWNASKNYDQLSQIAPTVVDDFKTTGDWKRRFALHAEAVGMTKQANQLMNEYEQRLAEVRDQLGAEWVENTKISLVRVGADLSRVALYLKNSFGGTILGDVGFSRPASQDEGIIDQPPFLKQISKERLQEADGDVIFVWSFGATPAIAQANRAGLEQMKLDPLWLQLNAVQQGNVYEVGHYWNSGSPLTANLVLDDLLEHLVSDDDY